MAAKKSTAEKEEKKEMVPAPQGAVPAFLRDYTGPMGTENIDSGDVTIPRLKIGQAISPEVKEGGLKEGSLFINVTGQAVWKPGDEPLIAHIVATSKEYILWRPRKDGGGILARARPVPVKGGGRRYRWDKPNQKFDVKVVTLPRDQDPADAPEGFADRLLGAESYLVYRVRLEIERSADRQEGFVRAREVLAKAEDSPERQEALRLLADRLDLPRDTLAGLAPARGGGSRAGAETLRLLGAGDRLERDVLAACLAHASLVRGLAELTPEHFDSEVNRSFRAALVSGKDDPELTALKAELDARAAREALDERTGAELLLRLRERKLKRDLSGADLARTTELQAHLSKVRQALAELT